MEKKAYAFFGLMGSLMFFIGLIAVIVVGAVKLRHIINGTPAPLVSNSPYFYLALTMMLLGTQLFWQVSLENWFPAMHLTETDINWKIL